METAKDRAEESTASSALTSSSGTRHQQPSAGEAVAAALKVGMTDANRITALNRIAEIGSAEQKAAALNKLMEIAGIQDL